ncbi:MAG: aminoacyl-tRNA hydrolase [Burkholderiales bacterium]|nr:aminoacyl-tRNA hydrolase [Burkholderiales bacterium]
MSSTIVIEPGLVITEDELMETFQRASGPGGQNVNKVSSAVQLRFDAAASPGLTDEIRQRLRRIAGRRMTADGVLLIEAHRHRTQARNRDDARERLLELLRQAAVAPRSRKATRPSAASRARRLQAKRERSEIKRARRTRPDE